jgi:plastocyanin
MYASIQVLNAMEMTMRTLRIKSLMTCAALLAIAGCATIAGTAGIADSTRTGVIHDVSFEQRMTPTELWVRAGDEIRWVNQRSTPVTVQFLEDALGNVTCQSGFSSVLRRQQESATIKPNESASLCFGKVGTVTYNARMDSPVAGGQTIESGRIHISQ